jgi:type IV secretory pathway VirB2 component (pilin)
MQNGLALTIAVIFVIVVAFLLLREVMAWYWKINMIVARLDSILAELKKANHTQEGS